MNIPLGVTLVIGAAGAGLAWHAQQQLAAARLTHAQLMATAAQLGIGFDPAHPGVPLRLTQHGRLDREVGVQLAAAEFIAFAQDLAAYREAGGSLLDAAMQQRLLEFLDRMMALNSGQFQALIAEVAANKDLKAEICQDLIGLAIMTLANEQPRAALRIFAESSALFTDAQIGGRVLATSLACWAKDDPLAALKWLRHHSEEYAALITEDTKVGMISAAAIQYPKFAFKLIAELDLNDSTQAIQSVVDAADTPPLRSATLAGLRAYLTTLNDATARDTTADHVLHDLALGSIRDGFESASQWLASSRLSPAEIEAFAGGLSPQPKSADTGRWIDWLGSALPPEQAEAKIRGFVSTWTQSECLAAGTWLGSAADSPAKHTAIRAYAETVASYQPEVAAQWAMTLPVGDERDATLKQIYQKWPKSDTNAIEAAAAFAKEHGIE
ncbi:MAG: hypothetical protein DUW69_001611 [Verrucomicrobia bacterium]|nr:MAG: hypothetical protein DUW69_001611 [Verrucomicrobiota bacterium]